MEGNQKQGRVQEDGLGGRCWGRIQSKLQAVEGCVGLAWIKPDPGCRLILPSQLLWLREGPGYREHLGEGPEWRGPWQSERVKESSCQAPCSAPGSTSWDPVPPHPLHPSVPGKGCGHLAGHSTAPCWEEPGSTPGTIPESRKNTRAGPVGKLRPRRGQHLPGVTQGRSQA